MLKEEAQRRVEAGKRKRWEEYRLVREAALGRPMRRQAAHARSRSVSV
jgi:hypothetical protein